MRQEFMRMADGENIDQETLKRLELSFDSQFASCPLRYFRTRKAVFVAGDTTSLSIRISGFGETFQARQLVCCNIDNPEDLEVSMDSCQMLLQSVIDPGILYLKAGTSTISGPRYSDLSHEIDQEARVLETLPRRDPDMVQIDQRIFRQTGTVYVQSPFYMAILERTKR